QVRVKIHPPDSSTSHHHIHIYNKSHQPLNTNLSNVSRRSPEAHIEIQPLRVPQNIWRP
ncbi:MAG: hypothetical protein K0Q74_390, partial [Gammaproteobacteria bacterium]|nr:hypothetical protein [Gammaproteobacteria bacterium]